MDCLRFPLFFGVLLFSYQNVGKATANEVPTVAKTPPMGWNSWNHFACSGLNEDVVLSAAKAIVSTGLKKAGYEYVNLDNCWQESLRASNGSIVPSHERFPNWVSMIQQIHDMGLKFGLYTDFGLTTCGEKAPGSWEHEELDAKSYAAWNVDYVKDDDCKAPPGVLSPPGYKKMSEALRATGRPIVFSVKQSQPIESAASVCNLRRVTHDIKDSFYDMMREVEANHNDGLAKYAHPGFWNDMDMVEIGNGNMTETEEMTHMAFWCLLKSPLILGNDLSNMTKETVALLSNANAIAVNQDALGAQGTLLSSSSSGANVAIAILANCSKAPGTHQEWRVDRSVLLRNMVTGSCLSSQGPAVGGFPSPLQPVVLPCNESDPTQQWHYENTTFHFVHTASGLCLTISKVTIPKYQLRLAQCQKLKTQQRFTSPDLNGYIQSMYTDYTKYPVCLSVDTENDLQVWTGPLLAPAEHHKWGVILFNRAIYAQFNVTLKFSDLGLASSDVVSVRDVWTGADLGGHSGSLTQSVAPHGVSFLELTI